MLEKIVKIENVGRFRSCNPKGDAALRRLSLIYAENGRGKTTLCAILRSLQTGQSALLSERKTLNAAQPPIVHLRIGDGSFHFVNGEWNTAFPDLVIFDSAFVNENVYSGEYVEHEHRKNLYRAVVGAEGVQLARQIEELDGKIRATSGDRRLKKETVARHAPDGTTVEDYLRWEPLPDVDGQIKKKAEELASRRLAVVRSEEIKAKGLFAKVGLPSLPHDFTVVLAKELTDVVGDAESRVRQHIAEFDMGRLGETWLSQGAKHIRDERCPFCGHGIRETELIAAYRSYFSLSYRKLKQDVTDMGQHVRAAIGEASLQSVQATIASNETLGEFWKQFIDVGLPPVVFADVERRYAAVREQCMILAQQKQDRPTERIVPGPTFSAALADLQGIKSTVAAYSEAVEAANLRVQELKSASHQQDDLIALERELGVLGAKKARFEPEAIGDCASYETAVRSKAVLEEQKADLRRQLDQICRDLLERYEQSINQHLDRFNAGFRVVNTRHLYTGGTPSSHYQIEINSTAVDLGDARTPPGTPSFKTTLSSGDRSALALAFFLAMLKQDVDIARRVVVLDDPFTSLDRFRRTCTQQMIQELAGLAEQVIVLSHDPLFLKLLFDEWFSGTADIKTLQLNRCGDTTVLGVWDAESEAQSGYMKDYAALLGFCADRKGELRAVARTIRPFLEGLLRSHFPGHFLPGEWLGDFLGKIRAAEESSGLQHAKADLGELDAINGYSKRYHHQQNANADSEPICCEELHGYVKRTLRLVGAG